jgi:hypothetical protein
MLEKRNVGEKRGHRKLRNLRHVSNYLAQIQHLIVPGHFGRQRRLEVAEKTVWRRPSIR